MFKFFLKFLVVLVAIVIVAFVSAAIVIPKKKTFTQETEINASRARIWQVLNDRKAYPEWQEKLLNVEIKDEKHWTEFTRDTEPLEFTIVQSEEPNSMTLEYKMGDSFSGKWQGELRRVSDTKTILRTTDTNEVNSVVMKVMMAIFFDLEEFANDWNQALKKRAETGAQATQPQ
ncbi:MAG: SRPBCC family protein [Pyrinomonadaceae bacterium]